MTDQTPLTNEQLAHWVEYEDFDVSADNAIEVVDALAAELLAARARIAELEAEPIGYTLATRTASGEWTFGRHYYRRRPAAESAARHRPPAWRVIELREVQS